MPTQPRAALVTLETEQLLQDAVDGGACVAHVRRVVFAGFVQPLHDRLLHAPDAEEIDLSH